ncbi:MAG: 1-deoxy-D-xylulose-5-phosphate reductoisomerase [Eubacterium sp.]|nr:1-deoxy-D-xylulose-5-phosphate reductoisomerase [Eubacterium sp.]
MKNISILGATGSIGTQALSVVDEFPNSFNITALSCFADIDTLAPQIEKYRPQVVCVMDPEAAQQLKERIGTKYPNMEIIPGMEGLLAAATCPGTDMLLTAVSGMVGLRPTLAAIDCGIDIALANKETLVTGGAIVMDAVAKKGVSLVPVDSEHSAIFQCLFGNDHDALKRVIITASGGPFRGKKLADLKDVTLEQALKHPSWSMGKKITIDSATLMNKGLEVIEAKWLFDLKQDQIDVVVHPQSIIHSMVEYKDRAVIAQLGLPDMALPIQIAFFHPIRVENTKPSLELSEIGTLTFEKPDKETFRCLTLAYEALAAGGTMAAALNAANEISVARFLNREIGFLDIPKINEAVMNRHENIQNASLEDVLAVDAWARDIAKGLN